jgi:hypothetical protein
MSIIGSKVLLIGPSGTGKTYSLRTLVDAGLEVFIIATDNGIETIGKFTPQQLEHIHWKYIPPLKASWSVLKDMGKKINQLNNQMLQGMVDSQRGEYNQILDVVDLCEKFVDDSGKDWGSVDSWGTDKVLVFDGLSGLNLMCRTLAVGGKPVMTQPDWGVSMDYELKFIQTLTGITAHLVLIAHVEREMNEVTGGTKVMPAALGRKNAPQLPQWFSDVILAYRDGSTYKWSTLNTDTDLKTRNLPYSDKLDPSFVPLINGWKQSSSIITKEK